MAKNMKRRMSEEQEFEIMKLVLDKFLWLGFIVMGWGMIVLLRDLTWNPGLLYVAAGAVLLILFVILIVKEYEIVK
jgi:hypothetical protein